MGKYCPPHFSFEKNKASKEILFGLKYKGNKKDRVPFRKNIGAVIADSPSFDKPNIIIPVPLHPKKQFVHGLNQSEVIARGPCEE